MATAHSRSTLRWLLALLVVAAIIGIMVFKPFAKTPSAEAETAPAGLVATTHAAVDTDAVAQGSADDEPLPDLESLSSLDTDKPPARRKLDLQHWTTEQGSRVYFMQADELPMLDVQVLFAGGSSRDGDQPGLATLTNAMLNEGAGDKDAGDIAAGFERLGAQFSNSSHRDMALTGLRSLTAPDKLDPALALFAEVVSSPSFPQDAFERLRNQLLASLRYRLQRPAALASEAFWAELYPEHPYGSLPEGTPESLQQITPEQLRAFHQQFYSSGNAVIAMVGAVDRQQAERIAQRLADAMPEGPAADKTPVPDPVEPEHTHIAFDAQQTHILVGQRGISRHDPDYAALYVGNEILGGSGFGSRLMEEIREKRGLSYSVSSSLIPMQAPGPFMISMQTRADQVDQALEVINNSLDEFIEKGPSEADLQRAKRQIMGQFPLSTASNGAIVGQLGAIGFYDLPLNHMQLFMDRIQALSTEQIREAFARHLDPAGRLVVTVGPVIAEPETDQDDTETAPDTLEEATP
ncbi:M16 family metallopeptidase [Pseudomonas saliphila]|uniref:M16 family metallopeptidase n=1 Tax=Pseudomonas saliphila TaxID=2586906 RepID=UPI00123AD18A|nr:pitrilysin family protein [Pseudomonas saliphila]